MVGMERKYPLLIGIAFIVIIVTVILINRIPPLPESGGGTRDCGPNRCPVNKYRLNSTSCKCIFIGVGDQRAEETSPEADPAGEMMYTSFSKPCNSELSDRGLLKEGVNTVRWLSDTQMEVNVIATANCALSIKSSGVKIEGKDITLWYSVSTTSPSEQLVLCRCGHELVYWIEGLDRHEQYPITVQELE